MSLDREDYDLFNNIMIEIMGISQGIEEQNELLEKQNQILLQLVETLKIIRS